MLEREVIVAWRSDQVRLMHFNFPFNTISNIEVPCEFVNIERVILYKLDGVGNKQYFWLFLLTYYHAGAGGVCNLWGLRYRTVKQEVAKPVVSVAILL